MFAILHRSHAIPTKVVIAFRAGHMHAASVFFDGYITLRTIFGKHFFVKKGKKF
jgi:hypothetical protein